ncbi:MAG: hypothetical protein RLZZ387_1359 [Chloroflexota bacterium]
MLAADPSGSDARPARLHLAEALGRLGRWDEALETARPLAESAPEDELHARALFVAARAFEEAGAWAEATAVYERYRALGTPIEPYARLRQAAAQQTLGQLFEAAMAYEAVATSDLPPIERAGAYERAIAARLELGEPARALELYSSLLDLAEQPPYRARVMVAAAGVARDHGEVDQAREWLRAAAAEAPGAPEALEAVAQLLADPAGALPPATAARVYTAHERWPEAIAQFDTALAAGEDPAQRRERALALRATGAYEAALAELAALSAADPASDTGRQAQLDWVQTVGQSGDVGRAIAGYREFATAYPDDPRAPEALARVVILLERQGDAEGAALQRLDYVRRYPTAPNAQRAHFLAGMYFYEAARYGEASAIWDELRDTASGTIAAQASYWMARAATSGAVDVSLPADLLAAARAADPDSFYAARARELLGETPGGAVPLGAPIAAAEWREAEVWLASWSGTTPESLAPGGEQDPARDPAVVRGLALANAGLVSEAIGELRAPLGAWREDPARLYMLARLSHEHGLTYVALNAAERLATLAGEREAGVAPAAVRRLIFPTPYRTIVAEQAREHDVDPLALYALLRQESHFNPAATSWVGARGLAQVMPATAQGIAQELGIEGFNIDQLYRPEVSVRFGAYYLSQQIDNMGGSLPGALAAYNGGLGNAWRWAGGETVTDPDLFAERIDFAETRGYVKLVYGFHSAYRGIYQPGG